jgi:hypothetical protein
MIKPYIVKPCMISILNLQVSKFGVLSWPNASGSQNFSYLGVMFLWRGFFFVHGYVATEVQHRQNL